jgi:hypothetical protein
VLAPAHLALSALLTALQVGGQTWQGNVRSSQQQQGDTLVLLMALRRAAHLVAAHLPDQSSSTAMDVHQGVGVAQGDDMDDSMFEGERQGAGVDGGWLVSGRMAAVVAQARQEGASWLCVTLLLAAAHSVGIRSETQTDEP